MEITQVVEFFRFCIFWELLSYAVLNSDGRCLEGAGPC